MKKIGLAAMGLLMLTAAAPAWGQGENLPRVVAVSYTIERFIGTRSGRFLGLLFQWAAPVPFDPDTELAEELDRINVNMIVVDEDLAETESDIKFYYRVRAFASFGPPQAPQLLGTTLDYVIPPGWQRVDPPPENAVAMAFWLRIPEIQGVNQNRLRGLIGYDVYWIVEVRLSNEESPEDEGGAWTGFSFYLYATENPLLAPPNPPPFADAGPDQIAAAGSTATLDGSRSFDSTNLGFDPTEPSVFEKDTLEYTWEWISGPERVDPLPRDDGDPSTAQVTLELNGDYVYRLLVEDGVNPVPSSDDMTITVVSTLPDNRGPRAVITAPTTPVAVGTTIRLSGERSSDPDGNTLTYRWRQTNAVGGRLMTDEIAEDFQPLSGVTEKIASWKAIKTGTYYFSLLVTDPSGFSDTAFASVQVIELATASGLAIRAGTPLSGEEPNLNPTPAAPAGCGAGLLPLAALPALLWISRNRYR